MKSEDLQMESTDKAKGNETHNDSGSGAKRRRDCFKFHRMYIQCQGSTHSSIQLISLSYVAVA